jgi:Cof subfamily protein (haloacid dehalogenase superfamily)
LNQTYKLAAIDLDGTLLGNDHDISPNNSAAVTRAAEQGAKIVLASGRQWHTIDAFAEKLGLPPDAPIIAYNGAMIRTHGGDTWFHQPMPAEAARKIVHYCDLHGCHLNYYLDDILYVRDDTHWSRMYQQRTGTVPHIVGDLKRFDGEQPTKLILIDTLEVTNRLLGQFQSEFGKSLYILKTEDEYLEFMDPGVSKGVALAQTALHLGVTQGQCIAFGDSYNDIPMLEWAGLGVAMENARLEVKDSADRVAPRNDADGVGTMLDLLFPIHPENQ